MLTDIERKVLYSVYEEGKRYVQINSDIISAEKLGITQGEFVLALTNLVNENMITGISFARANGENRIPFIEGVRLTDEGRKEIEK